MFFGTAYDLFIDLCINPQINIREHRGGIGGGDIPPLRPLIPPPRPKILAIWQDESRWPPLAI